SKKSNATLVARAIKMIFSAYRKDDFADPEGFIAQLGVILETYPDSVVRYVSSPLTGIQRRLKFPPSIAEVVQACDDQIERERNMPMLAALPRIPKREEAPVPEATPEEKRAMASKFDDLLASMRGTNVVNRDPA